MIELWFPKRSTAYKSVFVVIDEPTPPDFVRVQRVGVLGKNGRGGMPKIVRRQSLSTNYVPVQCLTLVEMSTKYRLDTNEVRRLYGDLCFRPSSGSGLPDELYRKPEKVRPVATVTTVPAVTGVTTVTGTSSDITADLLAEQRKTNDLLAQLLAVWQPKSKEDADALTLL